MNPIMEIDQESAQRLLVEGATLIFLGVPPGTEFGIDMKSWNTGEKFKGVKMIPPGLHYVYYSVVSKEGELAPRVGFVHNFSKSEFVFKKWDPILEDVSNKEIDDEEKTRLRENLLNLDKYLGPYPFDIWNKWKYLTSKVTPDLVARITPSSGQIRSALELVACNDERIANNTPAITKRRRSRPTTDEDREDDLLPQLKPHPGTELRFTPFPDQYYPEGSTPAEITKHSLDSSYVVETMVQSMGEGNNIIGELQFAFVCFLVGHSLEAFENWKRLVGLLCSCESMVVNQTDIYFDFLNALETHLVEIPEDFLADIVSNQNFVYQSLRNLFRTIHINELVDVRLKAKSLRFCEELTLKFEWDFSDLEEENEDEAPVVVDC